MAIPEINFRLRQIIDFYTNGSVNRFAKSIGVSQQKLNRLFNPDAKTNKYPLVTTDILQSVTYNYVAINCTWLLKGEGAMFIPSEQEVQKMAENYAMQVLETEKKMSELGYFATEEKQTSSQDDNDISRLWAMIESQQRQLESQQRQLEIQARTIELLAQKGAAADVQGVAGKAVQG